MPDQVVTTAWIERERRVLRWVRVVACRSKERFDENTNCVSFMEKDNVTT